MIKKRDEKKTGVRAFFSAFFITLAVLIFVVGIILVDFRGRSMTFADTTPPLAFLEKNGESYLRIKILGADKLINCTNTKNILDKLFQFICLPTE